MLRTAFFIYLALKLILAEEDSPYCSNRYRRLCQGKGMHVACQFPDPGPGSSCQNYSQIKFTGEMRRYVTHYINRRRQKIAAGQERVRGGGLLPRPEIMMMVEWDRELASLAQRLADQCNFVHDECRATLRYPYAGQTVGEVRWRRLSDSDELSAQRAIRRVFDAWWGERRRVDSRQLITPFRLTSRGTVWGHFSQLAVWTLRAFGCGAVRHGYEYPRLLLVCDFSHTNMLGQRTINPGHLNPCPPGTVRRPRMSYPQLCSPVRQSVTTHEDGEEKDSESEDEIERFTEIPISTRQATRKLQDIRKFPERDYEERTEKIQRYTIEESQRRGPKEMRRGSYPVQHEEATTLRLRGGAYTIWKTVAGQWIDKLQQELELKNKAYQKAGMEMLKFNEFQFTRDRPRFDMNRWSETPGSDVRIPPWRKHTSETDDHTAEQYQESSKISLHHPPEPSMRHRWQQTRDRPQRPGAHALLPAPPTDNKPIVEKVSMGSIIMDKDDVDQLFHDTGFNPYWRHNTKS